MIEIAISEFKAKCLSLLQQVSKTKQPIRITRFGKPIADVVPPAEVQVDRTAGMAPAKAPPRFSATSFLPPVSLTIGRRCTIEDPSRHAHLALGLPGAAPVGTTSPARAAKSSKRTVALSYQHLGSVDSAHERQTPVAADIEPWLHNATLPTREAPLTHEIAFAASLLPLHADPADRFLAATAQVLDLVLATADQRLLGWPKYARWGTVDR